MTIFKNPEAWTWNATYQRQIGFNTTIEVGYVDGRGLNQQRERNINQLLPGTVQANPGVTTDYLRPYKGFSFIRATNNDGTSKYNALHIYLTRRFEWSHVWSGLYVVQARGRRINAAHDHSERVRRQQNVWSGEQRSPPCRRFQLRV
jgi:hypothetical protein